MSDYEHIDWENDMSANFRATLNGIRAESIPHYSLARSLKAAEEIRMTQAASKRGVMNAAIGAVFMYGLVALVTIAFNKALHWDVWTLVFSLFGIFSILAYIAIFISWLVGRKAAGAVLLDCGPHPAKKLFLSLAVFWIFLSVLSSFVQYGQAQMIINAWGMSFGCYWLFMSTGRLQIRENGIWQYWSLLRWQKIKSYHWKGQTDATLMIQTKAYFSFMGRGAVPVAIEQKDAVDDLLMEHVLSARNG